MLLALSGNGVNDQSVPMPSGLPFSNALSPGAQFNQTFNVGNNYVVPPQSPQNAAQVCIILFSSPAGTVTLKGVNGDTGYQLGVTNAPFVVVPIGSAVGGDGNTGSFVINVGVQTVGTVYFI